MVVNVLRLAWRMELDGYTPVGQGEPIPSALVPYSLPQTLLRQDQPMIPSQSHSDLSSEELWTGSRDDPGQTD